MGRSRGGLTTKIHALVDALGLPILLKLTEGQAHDGRSADDMLNGLGEGDVLLVVIAACIPFAIWLLLPDFLENFSQSVVATLLFSNNLLLAATSGDWFWKAPSSRCSIPGALAWRSSSTSCFQR